MLCRGDGSNKYIFYSDNINIWRNANYYSNLEISKCVNDVTLIQNCVMLLNQKVTNLQV
jgi:hypothetical protein